MGTLRHIMIIYLIWMITSLLVGYSLEQGASPDQLPATFASPQASPLVSQRQSNIPSQQVIVPGGFQHQAYSNQFRGLDSRDQGHVQTPISIQNQQFTFLSRDPYARSLLAGRTPSSAPALPSPKPTSSRSLSPNFVEIINPNPQRLVSGGRGTSGNSAASGSTSNQIRSSPASSPTIGGTNTGNGAADVQYEYYDETDGGDVLYQYGNDFADPSGPSPSLTRSRNPGQYFAEISPSSKPSPERTVKNTLLLRNPSATASTATRESKRDQSRFSSGTSGVAPTGSSSPVSTKTAISPGNSRLFRPNRPSSLSSGSAQLSRETSSSFIPLVDESEEPEQGLALNGRSVQSTSHRGNSLSVRPPATLIRSTTVAPSPSAPAESNSSAQQPSAPPSEKPSRNRGVQLNSSRSAKSGERTASSGSNRRSTGPAILRTGNSNSSSGSRSSGSSRPPVIIRPRNLTRSRQNKSAREEPVTSSSTYRPDPNFEQAESGVGIGVSGGSSESPKASNALPSAEDYTVEYVEYPFNNDDNSSVVEYYEVSEETAQALLRRAKAKATQHKSLNHPHLSPSPKPSNNETKVTVSVSSKSSYVTTTTSRTTSSTTPSPPLGIESSSSEENNSGQIDPSGEVVISVATTKSVNKGKVDATTEAPGSRSTATPRVSFSRATGSSFVVASVQTSRSVEKENQQDRVSKTLLPEGVAKDNMPSGAETAPEYYEEEYTYPDNYPVLNSDSVTLPRPDELDHTEELSRDQHHNYNPNEYSHEVSIRPPAAISPTKSGVQPVDPSVAGVIQGFKESSEASTSAVVRNSDESYEDESGSHAPQPRKLPSKKGDIPPSHLETLVDDVSELEADHPLHSVKQDDLSSHHTDDESSYHTAGKPSTAAPTLTTTSSTTSAPPVVVTSPTPEKSGRDPSSIFSNIRFQEISPDFLPPGFKLPPPPASSLETILASSEAAPPPPSTSTSTPPPTTSKAFGIQFKEINNPSILPKGFKPRPSLPRLFTTPSSTTTTTTERPSPPKTIDPLDALKNLVQFKEITIPGLVPKDYKPPSEEGDSKEPTGPVFPGIKFETPANLLPPGYKPPASEPVVPIKFETPANLLPKGYKPPATEPVVPVKFEIPAHLLPAGYKPPATDSGEPTPSPASPPKEDVVVSTTKKPGGVVFPTKAGGSRITRPTTTEPPKGDTPPPPAVRIATGWPTRKVTEFTGWPTSSTTPPPPTSSTTTTTTTEAPTTTTPTTTTTTPPPKRSAPGTCPQGFCRMEATIRIVGGVKWVPEFETINTDEYKQLETTVKRELDGAYRSSGLAPWYRKVEIEGFNRGSVIVDYFLHLDGIDRNLSSDFVVRQFHKSLLDSADELPYYDESEAPDQLVSNGRLRFGRYTIDPRYTDFKVVNVTKDSGSLAQDPLIPQWGIAVIVIGLASLLFVIIFGVTVLVNRHKNSKKKNAVSLTQEMLSEFNKSHMSSGAGGLDNYGADDLYNMDDVWNDKQMDKTFDRKPTKRSQGSAKGSANYNIYDSWKTEWNGYYYNGNYYGDSGYAPSRRRSDYDTNF